MVAPLAKHDDADTSIELNIDRGRIVCAAGLSDFDPALFDPEYLRAHDLAEPVPAGRGSNWYVRHAKGDWVLRHYRRGGLIARLSADRYVWRGYHRSRSFAEFELLAYLQRIGLPAPRPIAARVIRYGLTYSADLITQRIAGAHTFAEELAAGELATSTCFEVGRCIRRYHERQIWHADLNAHNILLDADGTIFLLDFDRARRRAGAYWKAANLRRLKRSLDKLSGAINEGVFEPKAWRAIADGYTGA